MTVAPDGRVGNHPLLVILFFLLPRAPDIVPVLLTLVLCLYLTVIGRREQEPRPHFTWWGWWLSLVLLTHFIGYLGLRSFVAYRRWRGA